MNMNIKCIIVEDEPLAINLLETYIEKIPYLSLIGTFTNPILALNFLKENEVDLLFCDIQMPEITGLTLLKIINQKPFVILTTAYSEYALEGFENDVVDYLLKPITFDRFLKAVEKVSNRQLENRSRNLNKSKNEDDYIFVKDGTTLIKVFYKDILYIEGLKDYVSIVTENKKIVSLYNLKMLETQLPSDQFFRIHNSYIISINALYSIEKDKVTIGNKSIPISDTYRKSFKSFVDEKQIKT